MSAASVVLLAVAAGELATAKDVDAVIAQMSPSRHHDQTWVELMNALLDQRNLIAAGKSVPLIQRLLAPI